MDEFETVTTEVLDDRVSRAVKELRFQFTALNVLAAVTLVAAVVAVAFGGLFAAPAGVLPVLALCLVFGSVLSVGVLVRALRLRRLADTVDAQEEVRAVLSRARLRGWVGVGIAVVSVASFPLTIVWMQAGLRAAGGLM
jgi:fatty acid desaturase